VVVVGAGIAGAGVAAAIAPHRHVLLLEQEDRPGYHATGRSAAFWHESYGGPAVQPLSRASHALLAHPPADFSDRGFLAQRSAVTLGRTDERAAVDAFVAAYDGLGVAMTRLEGDALTAALPGLRADWTLGVREDACSDIDVAGLHAAYLRAARRAGAQLAVRAGMAGARWSGGAWHIDTAQGSLTAGSIVNAGGAWADDVAAMCGIAPVGITPFRRTVVQLRLIDDVPASLPLVIHVGGEFYVKGEGPSRIWLSPHDETPDTARDVAAEELDVAIAIDRMQAAFDWRIAAVEHKWAGLRSFAPDRLPVFGADPAHDAFFWCAGQGGFGIQTAPAISMLLAAQILGVPPSDDAAAIDAAAFAPGRF
jgi:D-arginine dehydrogenase